MANVRYIVLINPILISPIACPDFSEELLTGLFIFKGVRELRFAIIIILVRLDLREMTRFLNYFCFNSSAWNIKGNKPAMASII